MTIYFHAPQQLADKELEITMNDCFALYKDNMRKQFQRLNSETPYYKESEINELHNNHKREALNKVCFNYIAKKICIYDLFETI